MSEPIRFVIEIVDFEVPKATIDELQAALEDAVAGVISRTGLDAHIQPLGAGHGEAMTAFPPPIAGIRVAPARPTRPDHR